MIKYNLKCHNDHEFESWFSNSKEYDNLNKKGLLECIFCSSKKINKSISKNIVHNKTSLPEKINESKPLQHVNISDLLTAHKKGGRDA